MHIDIRPSAMRHGITRAEILCAIAYPRLRRPVISHRYADRPCQLFVGQYDDDEPYLEVVAEPVDDRLEVFHAMLLRHSTIRQADLTDHVDPRLVASNQRC